MRDYRNDFIQNVKLLLVDLDPDVINTVVATVSDVLNNYEITERSTEIIPFEDYNLNLLKMYVSSLIIAGKSKGTISMYTREIKKLLDFLGHKKIGDIHPFDIRNYLAHEKSRGISNRTLENERSYLSTFFRWLNAEELIDKDPCYQIEPIKYLESVKRPFTNVELDKIRFACKSKKERAVIEMLLSSGMRVAELVDINVEDIDFNKKSVLIRHGKGNKERRTYIDDLACTHLIDYLTSNNIVSGPLFVSKRNARYTTRGIREMLHVLAKKSKVDDVHPHRFRRTFATTLAARGMDIQEIQKLMGHTNINTTMIYVYIDDTQINNSYRKYIA